MKKATIKRQGSRQPGRSRWRRELRLVEDPPIGDARYLRYDLPRFVRAIQKAYLKMNLVAGYTRSQADKDMSAALGGLIEAFRYGDDAAIAGFAAVARKTVSGRLRVLVNTATGDHFHSPLPLYAEKVPADVFQVVEQEVERAMAGGWSTIVTRQAV